MVSLAQHWEQQGFEKGTKLTNIKIKEEKIIIAKKMLFKNKPLDEIVDFTGLTEKEIEKLK
jgi:predicted transposase/invertase (TIGR01784 family)